MEGKYALFNNKICRIEINLHLETEVRTIASLNIIFSFTPFLESN